MERGLLLDYGDYRGGTGVVNRGVGGTWGVVLLGKQGKFTSIPR